LDSFSQLLFTRKLSEAFSKDMARLVKSNELKARRIIRYFGRSLITKIEKRISEKPHGVMLQKELDAILEPKLSRYHKKHNITDTIDLD